MAVRPGGCECLDYSDAGMRPAEKARCGEPYWRRGTELDSVVRTGQRVRDRIFQRSRTPQLFRGPTGAVPADLVHGSVNLELVTIGVQEFDARVRAGAATSLV